MALALLAAVIACGTPTVQTAGTVDSLTPARRVVLQESESLFVGRPFRFYVTAKGQHIVTDDGSARVLQFGPTGTLEWAVGRLGSGPGEFRAPGAVVVVDDSTIAVEDRRTAQLKILRVPSGREVRIVRFPGAVADGNTIVHDTVWFGTLAPVRGAQLGYTIGVGSLVRWVIAESSAVAVWPGPAADLLSGNRLSPLGLLASQVVVLQDSLVYSKFGTRDLLEQRTRSGEILNRWEVPRSIRHGVPREMIDYALDPTNWMDPRFAQDFWGERIFSLDRSLALLSDGTLALGTVDAVIEGKTLNGTVMSTLLDIRNHRACVDRIVPHRGVAIPRFAIKADTLVLLTQELDAAERVRLVATYYPLLPKSCNWVPLEQAPRPTKKSSPTRTSETPPRSPPSARRPGRLSIGWCRGRQSRSSACRDRLWPSRTATCVTHPCRKSSS